MNEMNNRNWLVKYWQIFAATTVVIFNIGYVAAGLEEKPSRQETKDFIKSAITDYDKSIKDNYIEIKKVPGLKETLDAINEKLSDLNKRLDKWEERIYFKK